MSVSTCYLHRAIHVGRRKSSRHLFLGLLLSLPIITACNTASTNTLETDPENTPPLKLMLSSEEIMAAAYDNSYSVPPGFLVDERTNTPQSYTVYHVKDVSNSYELCTNELGEALAWEEADNLGRAVNGTYIGYYENIKYFEVVRELSFPNDIGNVGSDTSPGFARIFKCDYVNREGVDRNLRYGYGGKLNMRPMNASLIREFAEYLWQFAFFDSSKRKVLASFSVERPDSYDHTLRLAIVFNQGFEQCDRIEVVDWLFSADKSSGEVTREFRFLHALEAQLANGSPTQCEADDLL